jgi:hypothetical protein
MPVGDGTVAYTEVGGASFLGVNSTAAGYTDADRDAAMRLRDVLLEKYPEAIRSENLGWKPNDALFHAEATILLRAASANGGILNGRTIEIHVDRPMCPSCSIVLPYVSRELGYPTVTFVGPTGVRQTLRNGRWID